MKTKTNITNIRHEELVNLFSTALQGSYYFSASYPSGKYRKDDCFEDKLARALKKGMPIIITDYYAEGDVYGNLPHIIDHNGNVAYSIRLADIISGLTKASNLYPIAFNAFVNDTAEWDYYSADTLLQVIVFGETIYG